MNLVRFDNPTGEGIIGFDPWRTSGPDYDDAGHSLWYAGVTVNGKRIFQCGCPCGTCGITFKKIASPADRVSDAEAADLLGALDHVPSEFALRRLARILPEGTYYLAVIDAPVRMVAPGAPDDYFATEVVRLFGEPSEYEKPQDPATPYYRLGSDHELSILYPRAEIPGLRYSYPARILKNLLTQIALPLQDPATLERDRVEYWKARSRAGHPLTAFAVSVLDNQSPAVMKGDKDYPYEAQMLLTHCLLDGHHRVQAASETGFSSPYPHTPRPFRIQRPFRLRLRDSPRKTGRPSPHTELNTPAHSPALPTSS